MSLCLAAAGVLVHLGVSSLTLSWTHSVQKTNWQEDWAATSSGMVLKTARVMGSGAGMDPPPEARREGAYWVWTPQLPPVKSVILRRSGATEDWQLCTGASCRVLSVFVPTNADPVELMPCN